jgi:hypothetical protein
MFARNVTVALKPKASIKKTNERSDWRTRMSSHRANGATALLMIGNDGL